VKFVLEKFALAPQARSELKTGLR